MTWPKFYNFDSFDNFYNIYHQIIITSPKNHHPDQGERAFFYGHKSYSLYHYKAKRYLLKSSLGESCYVVGGGSRAHYSGFKVGEFTNWTSWPNVTLLLCCGTSDEIWKISQWEDPNDQRGQVKIGKVTTQTMWLCDQMLEIWYDRLWEIWCWVLPIHTTLILKCVVVSETQTRVSTRVIIVIMVMTVMDNDDDDVKWWQEKNLSSILSTSAFSCSKEPKAALRLFCRPAK